MYYEEFEDPVIFKSDIFCFCGSIPLFTAEAFFSTLVGIRCTSISILKDALTGLGLSSQGRDCAAYASPNGPQAVREDKPHKLQGSQKQVLYATPSEEHRQIPRQQ